MKTTKTFMYVITIVILQVIWCNKVNAQWVQTNSPTAGNYTR